MGRAFAPPDTLVSRITMPEQLTRTTRRGPRRKAELLAASARLFEEYGYHNVSMDDIAAAVGITGPALYRHFPNKHAVLVQALNEQVSSFEDVVEAVLADAADGAVAFEVFNEAVAGLVIDVHQVLLYKRERAHLNADEQEAYRDRLRRVTDRVTGMIRGWRPELSNDDGRLLSWVLQSLYSNAEEYRKGIDRAELTQLLAVMGRAAVSVELSSAPRAERHMRPNYVFTPVGRRQRILDAAAQLFYERGYQAVSVEDVAEASQTAIATVYQLVLSKPNLLHAILTQGSEGLWHMTTHELAFAADDVSPLETMVNTYIDLACGPHVRTLKILAADSVYLEEDARRAMRRSQREYVEEWVRALSELRPELTNEGARARSLAAIAVITETVQIANIRKRPNLQGEMRLLASAILHS
jgi:AcrR family transcriptional regulator